MSLLEHYGFDLREWLQSRDTRSPLVILSMARNLPEGSLLTARLSAQHELALRDFEAQMSSEEFKEFQSEIEGMEDIDRLTSEKQMWTMVPSLIAEQINLSVDSKEPVAGPLAMRKRMEDKKAELEAPEKGSLLSQFFKTMGGT